MRHWQPISLGPDVPAPVGAYSAGVRVANLLFVSGQVPRDMRTGELLGDDVRAQTRSVLANLRRVLEAGGASLDDVVACTVFLANIEDWGAFNDVYRETFSAPYPTRTVVGAELHGFLVEVNAVAAPSGPASRP